MSDDPTKVPGYHVRIKGSVTKTIVIGKDEVDSEDEAIERAHEMFVMTHEEGVPEHYNEETIDVTLHA